MTVLSAEGKFLMDAEAAQIGIVPEVAPDEQFAYVDPDPGAADAVLQGLGFGESDGEDIEVPATAVETVTNSELRVAVTSKSTSRRFTRPANLDSRHR